MAPGSGERRPGRSSIGCARAGRRSRARAERVRGRRRHATSAPPASRRVGTHETRLLVAAAQAAWLAGDEHRTLSLLDDAQTHVPAQPIAARIDHLRGQVAMRRGPVMDGYPLIVDAAGQIAEADPEMAVVMLAQAVHGCFYAGDTPAMIAAAESAVALASGLGLAPRDVLCRYGARHGDGCGRPRRDRRRLGPQGGGDPRGVRRAAR